MYKKWLKSLIFCGISISIYSSDLWARGPGGGGPRGGGGSGGGGGGVRMGGGSAPRMVGSPSFSPGRPVTTFRSPSFSQPQNRLPSPNSAFPRQAANPLSNGRNQIQRGNTAWQPGSHNALRPAGTDLSHNEARPGRQLNGNPGNGPWSRQPNSFRTQGIRSNFDGSNFARGNSLNINNRSVNLGNPSYRPSYANHPNVYRGSWNGNYGGYGNNNFGSAFTTGLGLSLGSRLGYGLGGFGGYGPGGYGLGGYGLGSGLGGYGLGFGSGYGGYGWGGYGLGGFGYRPLGWGLGGWGLGSLAYNSGYLGYSNPYYTSGAGSYGGYTYAQPIPVNYSGTVTDPQIVSTTTDGQSSSGIASTCDQRLDDAVAAFQQNNYDAALDQVNKGLEQCPTDAVMHEFRALVLFAKSDYQQAAATIHSVLAVGPGWNWTTVSRLYPATDIYTRQLRALEAFTRNNPQDGGSRFLLAYHYLVDGYPDAAERQLKQVVTLVPTDHVASDMLKMLSQSNQAGAEENAAPQGENPRNANPTPQPSAATTSPDNTTVPTPKPVDASSLPGVWHAKRPDGSTFDLTFSNESAFTWKFTTKGRTEEFGGTYTLDGNVLTLERKEGGTLIAGLIPEDNGKLNFKLIGAPPEDPGLEFSK